ncbi:MAG: MazG family protein [Mycobacteriales bacterium]|nr:MazG family protein [Mycobacteriales bacterium]
MTDAVTPARRVVVVATSSRTPAGLLSWPAWEVLRAGSVHALDGHPQLPALAGLRVTTHPDADDAAAVLLADGDALVVWLATDEGPSVVRRVGQALVTHPDPPELEVVRGSWDAPGSRLLDVVAVMDRLRSPGGCPWDERQTHESLAPYLLEEAYELLEAIESGSREHLREELGDVLLQVVFHARLAQDHDAPWSVDDVAGDLVDKLVRRHPHVFAGASADDLEGSWDALKAAEKQRSSVTDGVPLGQPALSLAAKLQRRAGKLGAPVPAYAEAGGPLWQEVARLVGEGLDPEAELRAVARAFRDRLAEVERELVAQGRATASLSAEEWQAALAR